VCDEVENKGSQDGLPRHDLVSYNVDAVAIRVRVSDRSYVGIAKPLTAFDDIHIISQRCAPMAS
jgi:hypothetical protein